MVYTYQWRRCDAGGGSCVDIGGATGHLYVEQPADVGNTIRVVVSDGVNTVTSAQTAVIGGGSPPPVSNPSGIPAPTGNVGPWTLLFVDDFDGSNGGQGSLDSPSGAGVASAGQAGYFPQTAATRWTAYPFPWMENWATYFAERTVSIHNNIMDIWMHGEVINGTQRYLSAAVEPKVNGASNPVYLNQGRYEVVAQCDASGGPYHLSWLLWPQADDNHSKPWPASGEVDFPEGDMSSSVTSAFMHRENATSGSDQYAASAAVPIGSGWHTYRIEWVGGTSCKFFLDNVQVGATQTSRVPAAPMRWILQTGAAGGSPPSPAVNGHIEIDWVAVYT